MVFLKGLIVVMTVLIVAGLALVVWRVSTIGGPEAGPEAGKEAGPETGPETGKDGAALAEIALDLAPGCRIAGIAALDGRLAVHVSGAGAGAGAGPGEGETACDVIYLLDPASGDIVTTIKP